MRINHHSMRPVFYVSEYLWRRGQLRDAYTLLLHATLATRSGNDH
jgi:hypothetical protein